MTWDGTKVAALLAAADDACLEWFAEMLPRLPQRVAKFCAYYFPDARVRKACFARIGAIMGEGTYANLGMMIVVPSDGSAPVVIGNRVSIAPNVTFVTESSPGNSPILAAIPYVKERLIKTARIVVEDDVWLGASVTILPGVRIGRCSVVGAGSLVLSDIEPYSVYAGTPARKIRSLS